MEISLRAEWATLSRKKVLLYFTSCNCKISAIRRSPKLTLFYLIHFLNNKSMQVEMTTQEDEKIAFALSHATFVATISTRRFVTCKCESSTQTVCKYIQEHCGNFN